MKTEMRKPNLKKSIKARTIGKIKREIKEEYYFRIWEKGIRMD